MAGYFTIKTSDVKAYKSGPFPLEIVVYSINNSTYWWDYKVSDSQLSEEYEKIKNRSATYQRMLLGTMQWGCKHEGPDMLFEYHPTHLYVEEGEYDHSYYLCRCGHVKEGPGNVPRDYTRARTVTVMNRHLQEETRLKLQLVQSDIEHKTRQLTDMLGRFKLYAGDNTRSHSILLAGYERLSSERTDLYAKEVELRNALKTYEEIYQTHGGDNMYEEAMYHRTRPRSLEYEGVTYKVKEKLSPAESRSIYTGTITNLTHLSIIGALSYTETTQEVDKLTGYHLIKKEVYYRQKGKLYYYTVQLTSWDSVDQQSATVSVYELIADTTEPEEGKVDIAEDGKEDYTKGRA